VLEELPGRVFVASIVESGSASTAKGAVLPGDRLEAIQSLCCNGIGLDGVMEQLLAIDSPIVALTLSRDASVVPVSFEGGPPLAAQAGEPLLDIAGSLFRVTNVSSQCMSHTCTTHAAHMHQNLVPQASGWILFLAPCFFSSPAPGHACSTCLSITYFSCFCMRARPGRTPCHLGLPDWQVHVSPCPHTRTTPYCSHDALSPQIARASTT